MFRHGRLNGMLTLNKMVTLFKKVSNPDGWKLPIEAIIPAKDYNQYADTVAHFTGGILEQMSDEDEDGMIEVYSEGYYYHIGR